MNIFVTDDDPIVAARNLCDKHINKMIVESAQMLANGFPLSRLAAKDCPRNALGRPRVHSYRYHPCTQWTFKTQDNMSWLISHAIEMGEERRYRWGKDHYTLDFIAWCYENLHDSYAPIGSRTEFAVAIAKDMNCRKQPNFDDLPVTEKYRLYIQLDKPFAQWTRREKPTWHTLTSGK